MGAATDWAVRRVRLYRPDRNPLRRSSDRWEALVVALAISFTLLSIWPATLISAAVYRDGLRAELSGPGARAAAVVTLVRTPAGAQEWQTGDGRRVTGRVTTLPQVVVGATYQVWIDGRNAVTTPPRTRAETIMATGFAALGLELGVVFLAFLACVTARHLLNRGRYAQWSAAWTVAEARWRRPRQT
ncbi:hypothetical protein Aple_000440 [Acrocarpospora pleiomorpha]|uniref:Uncharacterized protein n=2 Tax=Acrocarpospora pleiomorpha TaxID=90975 RepID=A0A5M3XAC4_9ACTN|nr:hypothetical protein Aple_000440 [Acrocarpospora pleiomorpha]